MAAESPASFERSSYCAELRRIKSNTPEAAPKAPTSTASQEEHVARYVSAGRADAVKHSTARMTSETDKVDHN
jgi:hypothetical protein